MTNQEMQRKQNGTSVATPEAERHTVIPAAEMIETPDAFIVRLDMPGATRDSIRVTADHEDLVVRGKAEQQHTPGAVLVYGESETAEYERVFPIGRGVNTASVDARFENGVLTITLAKRDEVKTRDIPVQGG